MELPHVSFINQGYLCTPVNPDVVNEIQNFNDRHFDHDCGWSEYAYWEFSCVYPEFLNDYVRQGFPFIWEFAATEDLSYFAYYFPTEDSKTNKGFYKTGRRKGPPKLSKKLRLECEKTSAANELLYTLGHKNGFN